MKLPEIRIRDAYLLRENASKHLHELWGKDTTLADDEWMTKKVKQYQDAWKPVEKKILTHICEALELEFRQDIIDVYIAPWFYAFSDPMVLGVMFNDEAFVDNLTHELLHRLFTDNTALPYDHFLIPEWEKLFGKSHSWTTLVHIPVHAVHKSVYLDLLESEKRYKHDVASVKKNEAYAMSWGYVDTHDYGDLVKKLRDQYKQLSKASR